VIRGKAEKFPRKGREGNTKNQFCKGIHTEEGMERGWGEMGVETEHPGPKIRVKGEGLGGVLSRAGVGEETDTTIEVDRKGGVGGEKPAVKRGNCVAVDTWSSQKVPGANVQPEVGVQGELCGADGTGLAGGQPSEGAVR